MAQNDIPFFKKPLPNLSQQAYGYNPYGIGGAFSKTIRDLAFAGYQKKLQEKAEEAKRQKEIQYKANALLAQQAVSGMTATTQEGKPLTGSQVRDTMRGSFNPFLTKQISKEDKKQTIPFYNKTSGQLEFKNVPEGYEATTAIGYDPEKYEYQRRRMDLLKGKADSDAFNKAVDNVNQKSTILGKDTPKPLDEDFGQYVEEIGAQYESLTKTTGGGANSVPFIETPLYDMGVRSQKLNIKNYLQTKFKKATITDETVDAVFKNVGFIPVSKSKYLAELEY